MSLLSWSRKQATLGDFKVNEPFTIGEIPVSEDETTCSEGGAVAGCDTYQKRLGDASVVWQNDVSAHVSDKASEAESEDSGPPQLTASAALASAESSSVGSANHHNGTCVECQFYFFSQKGCAKGADCRFCHEIHPRKKRGQFYKILKRAALAEVHSQKHRALATNSTRMPASRDASEHANKSCSIPSIHLSYSEITPSTTYIVGQRVHAAPRVERIYAEPPGLQLAPVYTVRPPLPEGLYVEAGTGLICGVPVYPRPRSDYEVSANATIVEANGVSSSIVLGCTTISIQIVDLGNDWASQVAYAGNDHEETFITVSL